MGFDLTINTEAQAPDLYREVCLEVKEMSQTSHRGIIKYILKTGNENSASCVFAGSTESVAFDAKSGCQVNNRTVKCVLWFDNESGYAARIIDIIKLFNK